MTFSAGDEVVFRGTVVNNRDRGNLVVRVGDRLIALSEADLILAGPEDHRAPQTPAPQTPAPDNDVPAPRDTDDAIGSALDDTGAAGVAGDAA